MKRMIMLAALAAFVIGFATTASAIVDVKASGSWRAYGAWTSNLDMIEVDDDDTAGLNDGEDKFSVLMRARTAFQFIANENLRGVWQVEIGTDNWGDTTVGNAGGGGFALGSDDIGFLENKHLYLDFTIPNTEINILAGILPLALPGGRPGNPVLDDDVAALVISTPLFDGVGLLGGWARAFDLDTASSDDATDTSLDVVFAAVPLDFDWLTMAPYFAYAYTGDNFAYELTAAYTDYTQIPAGLVSQNATVLNTDSDHDEDLDVWWLGTNFGLNFDPFSIQGHVVYGDLDGWENMDRSGWEFDIALSFSGFDFMTPTLWFAYTSGEDDNGSDNDNDGDSGGGESERLPVLSNGLAVGNFWRGGGITGEGGNDRAGAATAGDAFLGFYAIGLDIEDISFVDGLTHSLHFAHFWGNNDNEIGTEWTEEFSGAAPGAAANPYGNGVVYGGTLLDDESVTEYVFTTTYQMYDQLQLILDIGYLDFDTDDDDEADNDSSDVDWDELDGDWAPADAEKFLLGVRYDF